MDLHIYVFILYGVHRETLYFTDTPLFRMTYQRYEDVRRECLYLRSSAASNLMEIRIDAHELDPKC